MPTNFTFSERDIARFYSKFVKGGPDECWTWTAGRCCRYYGGFSLASKTWKAHRIAYCLFVGTIPDEHDIHHHCKNKLCVNPAHLECMHSAEHMRLHDTPGSLNRQRTHCPKGHPYDLLNTRYYNGKRYCRACRRLRYYACEKAQRKP